MPEGRILKGIGGFYYIKVNDDVIECKARGKFRKDEVVPMVGDYVDITMSDHDNLKGNIEKIYPRKTALIRPPVANVDQVVIIVAIASPKPNITLLDKFLLAAEYQNLDIIICFNKIDLDQKNKYIDLYNIYSRAGYKTVCTSSKTKEGVNDLRKLFNGKTTVFAGASGVGKSSLLNVIDAKFSLQTGEVSKKISRGKHTTRHVELLAITEESYVVDTPGFSSIDLMNIPKDELGNLFNEFKAYLPLCRFRGCSHTSEPDCAIINAVENDEIDQSRYQNYNYFYNQLKELEKKRYK